MSTDRSFIKDSEPKEEPLNIRKAEEVSSEQMVILAAPEAYEAFLARLDAPAHPNEWLRRTMTAPAPWDEE